MKYLLLIALVTSLAVLGFSAQSGAQAKSEKRSPDVEHGRYIVHHVAMCVQCHSPRDSHGQLVEAKLLHGDALPVESPFKDVRWAFRAPAHRGAPGLHEGAGAQAPDDRHRGQRLGAARAHAALPHDARRRGRRDRVLDVGRVNRRGFIGG
jgi:hypothetical protein